MRELRQRRAVPVRVRRATTPFFVRLQDIDNKLPPLMTRRSCETRATRVLCCDENTDRRLRTTVNVSFRVSKFHTRQINYWHT